MNCSTTFCFVGASAHSKRRIITIGINKAVELGFADGIIARNAFPEKEDDEDEDEEKKKKSTDNSVLFSRKAVMFFRRVLTLTVVTLFPRSMTAD